jgi:hypothetical protein
LRESPLLEFKSAWWLKKATESIDDAVDVLRTIITECSKAGIVVLVVLENLEELCKSKKQNFLYTLLNSEHKTRDQHGRDSTLQFAPSHDQLPGGLVTIGLSRDPNYEAKFEKRVDSRFCASKFSLDPPPTTAEELSEVILARLALPDKADESFPLQLPAKLRIRVHEQIKEGLRQYYWMHPLDDFMCEEESVIQRVGNCLAGMKELDVDGNFIFEDGLDFYKRMMSKFTPGLGTEHPESKQRALHDLSSQQWLITLIVYRMSEGPSSMISLETVYEEARKFNEEVNAQSGRSFQGRPRKRQKVALLDLDDLAHSSFEVSWKGLLDKGVLAPWLPVYRNLDPKGVEPINPMRGRPDPVVIDSAGFPPDPPPFCHRDQEIRGLTNGYMMVIRNMYDDFQAKKQGWFGPNPFASLPPQYLQLVHDVEP